MFLVVDSSERMYEAQLSGTSKNPPSEFDRTPGNKIDLISFFPILDYLANARLVIIVVDLKESRPFFPLFCYCCFMQCVILPLLSVYRLSDGRVTTHTYAVFFLSL
jgi:hypothetical protein